METAGRQHHRPGDLGRFAGVLPRRPEISLRDGRGGGPKSDSTRKGRPDRPDANQSKLKMLTLNEGREEPDVATLELAGPLPGGLQWLSGGKFLVSRSSDHDDDRLLEVLDPATGQRKATLALQVPSPGPSRPKGNSLPLPTPPPNSTETPSGWYETQSVLCADGSRLAAHFNNAKDESKRCQNRIGVWDVRGRKLLGT